MQNRLKKNNNKKSEEKIFKLGDYAQAFIRIRGVLGAVLYSIIPRILSYFFAQKVCYYILIKCL